MLNQNCQTIRITKMLRIFITSWEKVGDNIETPLHGALDLLPKIKGSSIELKYPDRDHNGLPDIPYIYALLYSPVDISTSLSILNTLPNTIMLPASQYDQPLGPSKAQECQTKLSSIGLNIIITPQRSLQSLMYGELKVLSPRFDGFGAYYEVQRRGDFA